ncbi:MAG: N-acetyltransferase family protein [Erysipelotrichaceae bacterium]|nr:N-acetyltransferase family protein [Erysipelotrichaceae bacterium]
MNIRTATIQDANALLDIYAYYVLNTAITFEYDVPTLADFQNRITSILNKYPYIVTTINNKIVGYAYANTFKNRAAYDWSVEMTIYIDINYQKQGIGKKLYETMEDLLKLQGITNINACITYPDKEDEYANKNSVSFHEHMGYQLVGQFHQCGYKFNRWYSMVWMEKMIGEHVINQPEVKPFREIEKIYFNKNYNLH